jgi:transcriptional regulator with XRE-family HTH domain
MAATAALAAFQARRTTAWAPDSAITSGPTWSGRGQASGLTYPALMPRPPTPLRRHRSFGQYMGVRLREYRQQRNLTREDLARELRRTGLLWTRSTIEELESGSRFDISVTELLQLAIAFQLPPEKFLESNDERWLQGRDESSITIEAARETLRGAVPSATSAIDPGAAAADDFWTYEDRGRLASRAERRAAQRLGVSVKGSHGCRPTPLAPRPRRGARRQARGG